MDLTKDNRLKLPTADNLYPLDRAYDDVRPGAFLLLEVGGGSPAVALARVTAVVTSAQKLEQLQDTVTAVTLTAIEGYSLPALPDPWPRSPWQHSPVPQPRPLRGLLGSEGTGRGGGPCGR